MNTPDKLTSRIAFANIKGINLSTAEHLLGVVGSPEQFFSLPERTLASLTGLDSALVADDYRRQLLDRAADEVRFVCDNNIHTFSCVDDNFPRRLKDCADAPALLYAVGDCNLNCMHSIAIVGTRHATAYGIDFVKRLIADLAERLDSALIISGLAYGIDIAAHRAALDAGLPTVAVVAHGLNTIYPADHRSVAAKIVREGGAIITEYDSSARIHRHNFLARNRIIAGLADVTIVVESDTAGGAMTTARIAAAYNRDVVAIPGRITDTYSRGCNQLLAEKTAEIIRSADDLIDIMGWTAKPSDSTQMQISFDLSPEEQIVVDHIQAHPDHTVNDICVHLGMPLSHLSAMLFELEMRDVVMTLPGGKYAIINAGS